MSAATPSFALPAAAPSPVSHASRDAWSTAPSHDRLTGTQRRVLVGAILALHVAGVWGLLQVREVRDAVAEVAPLFVSIVAPEKPKVEPPPPPPPRVEPRKVEIAPRVIAAAPSPAPAPFVVPAPPPEVVAPTPVVVAAPAPVVAPPTPPALPPAPKVIPASAVQYLEPPAPEYPRLSKRLGESGRVVIRVFIDEAGLARNAQVNRASGFARLDEAALSAVQKARFKPYTENGQALPVWTLIPIDFELEK